MLGHYTRYCKSKRCVLHINVKIESNHLYSSVLEQTLYASNIKAIVTTIHFKFTCSLHIFTYICWLLMIFFFMQGNKPMKNFLVFCFLSEELQFLLSVSPSCSSSFLSNLSAALSSSHTHTICAIKDPLCCHC